MHGAVMQFFTKEASERAGSSVYFAAGSKSSSSYHYAPMIFFLPFSTLPCKGTIGCLTLAGTTNEVVVPSIRQWSWQ